VALDIPSADMAPEELGPADVRQPGRIIVFQSASIWSPRRPVYTALICLRTGVLGCLASLRLWLNSVPP
jgi:hypothetical protein